MNDSMFLEDYHMWAGQIDLLSKRELDKIIAELKERYRDGKSK